MADNWRENLNTWYATPRGKVFSRKLVERLDPWVQGIFGYHAVQLGLCNTVSLLEQSRINHKVVADFPDCGDLVCEPEALPFDADSIDLLVAAHALEYSDDPHAFLREAERVLVPEGHLIVVGIDPWTLWGGWKKLTSKNSEMYSQSRVKDWLGLLGFDSQQSELLPMVDFKLPGKLAGLPKTEQLANLLVSNIAGGYALLAKKRVTTLRPFAPSWRRAPKLVPGILVKPAARSPKRVRILHPDFRRPKPRSD